MNPRSWRDPVTWAALLVLWAVAWSVAPGRIAEDTKNDLLVDPWGFLARALHLWDPQVTWGGLQNQAFGYLFPMGPFFALGSEIAPMWVVQRMWWSALLTAGFVGMMALLGALRIAGHRTRVVGALAYVLAPRVISTIGGLSSEAHPQLLAPAVLAPLVLASRGRLSTRQGALCSGVAALACGGVNATATLWALVPAGVWLITRSRWWASGLTWAWVAAVVAACSWWLVPLIIMGGYSPPFLDWIENAQAVSAQITMLDVLRGTTHWLGHLVTPGGVWWPAGYELATSPLAIMLTTAVMALGLGGLALRGMPHRRFALIMLAIGVFVVSVAHVGPFDSPLLSIAHSVLDGPLAPLRNVHKADALIRLPLILGLTYAAGRLARWRPRRVWARSAAIVALTVTVVAAAAPGLSGAIAVRGTFTEMAPHWRDLGDWLDSHRGGVTLILPAATFGEYTWGRTIDEPLRSLTSAPYAVRDGVPLTPAGTVRFLDDIERRIQTGQGLGSGAAALRAAGVRYIVIRNDLSTQESGAPPVALARASVEASPQATFVRGFGRLGTDASGERVAPLEVFELTGPVAADAELWPVSSVRGSSGASEDLSRLAGLIEGARPVIFDGDRTSALVPSHRVVTDGFRARTRWFGAPRGEDVTSTDTRVAAADAPDYLPWSDPGLRSAVRYAGIDEVSASSSLAQDFGYAGLQPAHRPFAALDDRPGTAWLAMWDPQPRLTVTLPQARQLGSVTLTPAADPGDFGDGFAVARRVRVRTDAGVITATLRDGTATEVTLPKGATRSVSVAIETTSSGSPRAVVTGITSLTLPGVSPTETIETATSTPSPRADTAVLGSGLAGRSGCTTGANAFVCFGGRDVAPESTDTMRWLVRGLAPGERTISGALAVDPAVSDGPLLDVPGVKVRASSVRSPGPATQPEGVVDSDPRTAWSPRSGDESPTLTMELDRPVTVGSLRLTARRDWSARESPLVSVSVDGVEVTRRLTKRGVIDLPDLVGRQLEVSFRRVPGSDGPGLAALELEEVGIGNHTFAEPRARVSAGCGQGPVLRVGGRVIPTRAEATREGLFAGSGLTWEACQPVRLDSGSAHQIEVGRWGGLVARSAILAPTGPDQPAAGSPRPEPVALSRHSPTRLTGTVEPGEARLMVLRDNANPGWSAHIDGRQLTPQVVDGRRLGFVIPEGVGGEVVVEFGPDRAYRLALGLGGVLAAGLVVAAAIAHRRSRARAVSNEVPTPQPDDGGNSAAAEPSSPRATLARRWGGFALILLWCAVIAGPVGAVAGAVTAGAVRAWRTRPMLVWLPLVIVIACLAAAAAQAIIAPGRSGSPSLEGAIRLVLVGAFVATMCAPSDEAGDQS